LFGDDVQAAALSLSKSFSTDRHENNAPPFFVSRCPILFLADSFQPGDRAFGRKLALWLASKKGDSGGCFPHVTAHTRNLQRHLD
jgi:hypothetical protein